MTLYPKSEEVFLVSTYSIKRRASELQVARNKLQETRPDCPILEKIKNKKEKNMQQKVKELRKLHLISTWYLNV